MTTSKGREVVVRNRARGEEEEMEEEEVVDRPVWWSRTKAVTVSSLC